MKSGYLLLRLEIVILKKGRPICCMNGTFLFIVQYMLLYSQSFFVMFV